MKTLHTIYSTFAKHNMASLRLLLVMLLTLTASTAWGKTQTYTLAKNDNGKTVTTDDVTWNIASGAIDESSSKCKLTGTITISLPAGATLNSVTITGNGNSWGNGATITFNGNTTLYTFSSCSTYSLTKNKTDLTYSFVKSGTSSKNAWVKSITVDYTAAPSCSVKPTVGTTLQSVTATENSIKATIPISSIGGCNITENGLVYSTTNSTPTVGGSGCTTVTTTACGSTAANKTVTITGLTCGQSYYIRGYATNEAGTSYTNVTTKSTSDCPKYTVTLMDDTDNPLTQSTAGEVLTLPKRDGCEGYTFAGWTKSWTEEQDEWTTTAPTIISAGSYTPTANENLYPVYTKTVTTQGGGSGNYELVTSAPSDWSGTYLIVDGTSKNCFNGSLTTLDANGNYKSVTISDKQITSNTTTDSYSVTISKSTTNGKYYIKTASGYYIGSTASTSNDGNELKSSTSTKYDNSISINSDNVTIKGPDHILKFFHQSNADWRFRYYKSTTTSNVRLPQLYKKSSGTTTTTSYISVPDCDPCNALQAPNVTAKNITTNSFTLSWDPVAGATSYNVYNFTTDEVDETTDLTYTFYGLDPNTEYSWEVEAVSATCNGKGTTGTTTTLKAYTITWKNADGTVLETDENVPHGTTPTYDGETPTQAATEQYTYTFSGWSPEVYAADKDQIYTAQFDETTRQYTVTFNANGHGTAPDQQSVDYGTKATEPTAPTAFGYTFGGWYKEAECTNVWDFATDEVTGNITLYAQWTAKSLVNYRTTCLPIYEVTLNPDGGTISDVEWVYNSSIGYYTKKVIKGYDVSLPVATKAGYINTGWKTDPTTNVVSNPYTVNGNVTLIAAYDCALASVGISGTYALTVGDVFQLKATAYDSNGNELECPANATYSWERYNSVDGVWEAITDDNSDGDNAKLTFNNCQIANCGTYRCHITYGDCGAWSQGYNVHCFHLKGNFEDDWNKEYAFNHTDEEGIATLSMDLLTGQTFEFKIYDGITQYGNGGTIETSVTGWTYGTDNQSNTIFKTGADGTYIFKLDFKRLINSENILVLDVTYPPANQAEGHTIYYDNLVHKWENVYYRIGHNRDNGDGTWGWNQNQKMTLVPGTSHLYKTTTPTFDNFEAWHIANNVSWADKNSIYLVNPDGTKYDITHASVFKKFVVVEDITLTPEATGTFVNDENCTYYADVKQSGMKMHKATVIPATGGTITVSYTDHDGTAVNDFTSGDRDLAHTCLLTITATPDAGYSLRTLTVNDEPFTSGKVHTLAEDAVIKVVWEEKAIPTFAWSADSYTAALEADNTFPTLSNPDGLSVTYTSSDPTVATIDANGNITLVATGTTTITAAGAESATHKAATDTYELTVVAANCKWVETDIANIDSGDEVVIAMSNSSGTLYALPNESKTSDVPDAIKITNTKSFANDYIWIISKNGNNLTFKSYNDASDFLTCNNADAGVRVNNGTNKTFVIDATYGYLKNTANDRYVGVHNDNIQWYSYKLTGTGAFPGKIAGQTLKFYKRECLDVTKVWVEGNLTNVTCAPQLPQQLAKDGSITLTFTAADGYALPDNVTVTNATKVWDKSTGKLTISNPTDNVLITMDAVKMHTVTWMVGSNSVLTEEVANATGVTQTPGDDIADDAIGDCANAFMGWSETALGSTEGQSAPADLCTAAQMKAKHTSVTGNKTFYAVFATASSGGGENTAQVFATSSLGTTNSVTTGFTISAEADKKDGYYQDGSGTKRYVQVMKSNVSTPMFANTPTSVTITAKLGGGSTKDNLTNSVYAIWLDKDGNELGTAVLITDKITATTGSNFTANLPIANATSAYGVRVYHQKETSYNVRYYAISLSYKYNNTTYSNYVTNCCALAPATNLIVSGTTASTATLTWTAPSPTTGITKLQVRNAETDTVVVDNIAVNTTTTTINDLTECTSYKYYVVSVGEDCEVVSNIVTAQPFGNAKTVNYNYNSGSGSPASFTTSCTNQTITLPVATRTGYDFNGWYTAATGGTKVGDAGDTYEPATSPVTLYAQWTIKSYTVTWNPNGGNWDGNTSNIVQTYEYGAAINKPDDPTRENGIFKGWTPTPASTMPAGNKTYTAQWEMVYTLTFVDMNAGGTTSTLTQTSSGQNIVAPTANSEVCDMWTFIGWAPSNSLNGDTNKPTGFIAAGETIFGSQITGNKTYYSVYSYNSDNTQEFEIGKSGTYLMYAISGTTKYYATTAKTGGFYGNPETSFATYGPSKFTLTYNKTENKYIIYHENTTSGHESKGYFELDTYDGDVDVKSETPSLFTIQAGSNESFIIRTDYITSTGSFKERSFGYDGSFTDYSGDNPVYFEPASEIQYYNAADCGEVETYTMSFHNPFGDKDALIWYDAEHEESYYTDKPLNTSIDVFPTMVYNGWAFIGWTANQQYNELIGDDNLDDENSATNDPASSLTIYSNTAGWSYKLNSNVTMYPVFTKYEDNEDIDLGSGGEYYMYFYREGDYYKDEYFGADNHYKRMYALAGGGDNGEFKYTTNCNDAQIFEFIKEGDGWNIRVKNADGSYPTKSYLVNTSGNDYDLVSTKPSSKWSITKEPEGDYTMWYKGNATNQTTPGFYVAKAREYSGGSSWNFKCYNQDNDASQFYYKVYLGTCENRVFSSNPTNKPIVTLTGKPIVTSTQDQSIRAQGELSISATKLAANGTITLTSDNADVYFATDKTANFSKATKPVTPLTLKADEKGKLAMTTVYVHYKPTSTSTLGVQTANITATTGTNGQPDYATATTTAALRNLPADFVIAAKVNDIWYALPNNCNSTSIVNGLPIDVDNEENPSIATFAPAEAKWGLKPVYTTSGVNDRYGDFGEYFVFAETNTGDAGLLYSNKDVAQVQTQGTYANISTYTEKPRYEWIPTTTDLITYQLASAQDGKQLNVNVNGVFGTHSQLVAENELRLLPIDAIYQHAEVQVVEWRADAVVFMYTGDPNHSVTTTLASTSTTKSLSEIKFDHGVYKMPVSNLLSNASKTMCIKFHDGSTEVARTEITIPVIINGETNTSSLTALAKADYETIDVVILNGGKLTATEGDAAKYRFRNVTIYGGGKLVIGEGKYLSMASIILRAGGFADDGAYEYVYPQFDLQGTLTNSAGEFKYDYITDYDHWYHLVLPFAGDLGTIKYPTEFYGTNVNVSNGGSWVIKRYAGEIRATGNYKAWVDIETDNPKPTATTPGVGYIFWGAPKKVKVNGVEKRQQWSIQRISMTKGAGTAKTEEIGNKKIQGLSSHKDVANNSGKVNDQGWNLIGNPYMVNLTGLNSESLKPGKLVEVEDAAGNWTGQWKDNEDGFRYVTIPSDHFDTYTAQRMTAFTEANPMIAGRAFFIQLEDDDAGVTFSAANRASLLAARVAANEPTTDIETGIVLSNETMQDEVNFWIKDGKTNDYEYNADYPKTPNNNQFNIYGVHTNGDLSWVATGPEYAAESMPIGYQVPAAGTYMLSVSEEYYSDEIDALYVTDHEMSPEVTTDLMSAPYEFSVNQAETNDKRFTVSIKLKKDSENDATGLDNININGEEIQKFIYQDKMYILHHGIIYDATGKRVITINK